MFKLITSVLDPKKNPTDEELQKIPSYIFCRWLSGNPHTILAANQINLLHDIPVECQYKMIKEVFSGKIQYIPYPKNNQEETSKTLEYLAEHFKINFEDAKEYLELIDPQELKYIIEIYQTRDLKKK